MKSPLETALALIAKGSPLPVDLQTALMADGIDVSALQDSDEQLSLIPLLDETLEQ